MITRYNPARRRLYLGREPPVWFRRHASLLAILGIAALATTVVLRERRQAFPQVAWPDECIYLVGARNLLEAGSLRTNFYLTHSLLARGYPHRDVHMPGYVLALVPFVSVLGPTLDAGAALNVLLFGACIGLVYVIGRAVFEDRIQAMAAAALFTVLPPFPGYLFVVYPELVVSFVLLAGLAWLVSGSGTRHAAVAGFLFGLGPLFRETLLLAFPVYAVRIARRDLLRGFLPAAAATLILVVAPLSRDRAIHPNALYPSVLEEAGRSDSPAVMLASALWRNVAANLSLTTRAEPLKNPEDTVLLFLAALGLAGAVSLRHLSPGARRFGQGVLASLVLLTLAVLLLYVVRERGGVWGGVRAYMAWAPVLLVLALPLLFRARARGVAIGLVLATAGVFLFIDQRQSYFFMRYKQSNHEDQDRNARYLAAHIDRYGPRRIVSHSFLYGLTHYPVEVVWSLPRDHKELQALEAALGFDFLAFHEASPLRLALVGNPRYVRVNREDRRAEFLIWRRLY